MTADAASALLFSQPRPSKRCKHKVRVTAEHGSYYVCTTVNWNNARIQNRVRKLLDSLFDKGFKISMERIK